jgi:hypothetical protein
MQETLNYTTWVFKSVFGSKSKLADFANQNLTEAPEIN